MKSKTLLFLILNLLAVSLNSQTTYIHCGNLIDGVSNEIQKEMTIVIEKNEIVGVIKGYVKPEDDSKLISLANQTVLPGLIDMHVHIENEQSPNRYLERFTLNEADVAYKASNFAYKTLMAGFTTVRDLGGTGVNVSLRNAINAGLVKGPRVFTVARSIAITGGHGDRTNGAKRGLLEYPGPEMGVADGPDECRKAVRQQVKNGADLIKITATGGVLSLARDGKRPQFTLEEIEAIIETANDFGIAVAAHAHGDEGMRRAVEAGISSIEHGTMMSEETMDLMIEKGTYYVPTITAGKAVSDSSKVRGFFPEMVRKKAAEIGPLIQGTFERAYKKGVKIAFGTDAGVFPHGKNALEFYYMTQAGMPEMEAIKSATYHSSKLLRMDHKLGTIEIGKWADIIAVPGNPLEDIRALQKVQFVMKNGEVYKE